MRSIPQLASQWLRRWPELIPELVLVAGLTFFLVDEPDAATSAFKSGQAIALMTLTAIVWVLGRFVFARFVPWRFVGTVVFGLAALGVLAVVVLPAYDDETVVEAFPVAVAVTTTEPVATTASAPEVGTDAATEPAPPASTPATTSLPPAAPTAAPPPAPPPDPAAPVRLRTAQFEGIDHRASGTVSLYRAPDGRYVVGLEEFDIQPGPDYDLYLVPGADRHDRDGGARLDDLRGNQGTQFYDVPADLDVSSGDWTVLVWCETFAVPVANATPV